VELAATAKESYDTSGLVERKDTQIHELTAALREADALAAKQKSALTALETNRALLSQARAAQAETIARLEGSFRPYSFSIKPIRSPSKPRRLGSRIAKRLWKPLSNGKRS